MTEPDYSAIARDLEMLLDQLYYWARRAQDSHGKADELAGRMFEVATANLQIFVTTLVDCFRPLQLTPVRVPISEFISAIARGARAELGAVSVTVSGEADGLLVADVTLLTRALSGILGRLDLGGARLDVGVARTERGGRRGVEISLRSTAGARAGAPREGTADLEWVLAARIVSAHAGDVREQAGRGPAITLFLPADT